MADDYVGGASSSLNKTITELKGYMANLDCEVESKLRKDMYQAIAEISRWWAEEGFKIGFNHGIEAKRVAGEYPPTEVDCGECWLAPDQQQELILAWPKRKYRRGRSG